ncbi:MAG: autotransporter outer membrane beta-barrel domain-containing protein [Puniceicoccales bacterium]|jgi:outer membrane autotransporter protein|nr:autotransporter outer membrane beta-barrel domain-containing protein [Puniceicoccales bacterium]
MKGIKIMNIGKKKIFTILMATIWCLFFNSNLNTCAVAASITNTRTISNFLNTTSKESLAVTANNLLTNAFSSRMTNVKGCPAGLFTHAVYGHMQEKGISGESGYKNNMYGPVLGIDNVWAFDDEEYFRLGTALGYIHGGATPSGTGNASNDIDFNHAVYAVELFGAYEHFYDECLKTNIGVILGYNHGRNKLHMDIPPNGDTFDIKYMSSGVFLGVEFIKNLYTYDGYQFGPWFQTNYVRISMHTGSDEELHDYSHKLDHDLLSAVIGLNVEKETFKHADKKLTLSLKTGWEQRIMQNSNTNFSARFSTVSSLNNTSGPIQNFSDPAEGAIVLSFKASQKLSNRWNIVGSYFARFNKDISAHNISGGVEYAF